MPTEQLARRGLRGTRLGISDAHEGLRAAITKILSVEIQDCVGEDNIFIFGLTSEEVARHRSIGSAGDYIAQSAVLSEVLNAVQSGAFSPEHPERYRALVNGLRFCMLFEKVPRELDLSAPMVTWHLIGQVSGDELSTHICDGRWASLAS